jgi:pilus assembly protein Flp/PilA
MARLRIRVPGLLQRQDGQGVIEYALILLLVAMIVIIVVLTMGKQVENIFSNVAAVLKRGG